jgi:hypothetical protein
MDSQKLAVAKAMCAMTGCKRKLRLAETTTLCKCTKAFCGAHRHAECHNCDFDYQAKTQRDLSNALVKVRADKVEVI